MRMTDTGKSQAPFSPGSEIASDAPRNGKRRHLPSRKAVPLRWPSTMPARRSVLKLWRRIAMKILHDSKVSFRLMAVVPDFIIWNTGEIWQTNDRLAEEGGECDEKTIRRDVVAYTRLGIFIVERGWRRNKEGNLVRCRTIRLSIPSDYDGSIPDFEDENHADHVCPDDQGNHADHVCPNHADIRGPITVDHYVDANSGGDGAI